MVPLQERKNHAKYIKQWFHCNSLTTAIVFSSGLGSWLLPMSSSLEAQVFQILNYQAASADHWVNNTSPLFLRNITPYSLISVNSSLTPDAVNALVSRNIAPISSQYCLASTKKKYKALSKDFHLPCSKVIYYASVFSIGVNIT